jgi:hypothetical protein
MLDQGGALTCCVRCAGAGAADQIARRRHYRSAVFPPAQAPAGAGHDARTAGHASPGTDAAGSLPGVAVGTVLDVSPHVLVVAGAEGDRRFTLPTDAVAWRGGLVRPTAVRAGDQVVVRTLPGHRDVATKMWAAIGRVTGTIVERNDDTLVVSEGVTKRAEIMVIPAGVLPRILVRFPRLEPGHLVDVIGLRRGAVLDAVLPATSQPTYRADRITRLPPLTGLTEGTISGSATWHEPQGPAAAEGVAYPAIDPAAGCAEAAAAAGPACISMPYLAVGSMLTVLNECTGCSRVLPVTGCGATARLFGDRCLTCGTSPRGRIADLTMASFVGLGGELEQGCFNAAIAVGR